MPGATMMVVHNSSGQNLLPGNLVAFAGVHFVEAMATQPLVQVDLAARQPNAMIAGVVYSAFDPALLDAPPEGLPESEDLSGEYLLIVIQGPAQLQIGTLEATFQPGQPLTVRNGRLALGEAISSSPAIGTALSSQTEDGLLRICVNPQS
jgi:hypothetical protein